MKKYIDINDYRIKFLGTDNFDPSEVVYNIKITHRKKGIVGIGRFYIDKTQNKLFAGDIFINEEHRRLKLGTEMYKFIELITNLTVHPSQRMSNDAKLFWNQKNRPFGKLTDKVE